LNTSPFSLFFGILKVLLRLCPLGDNGFFLSDFFFQLADLVLLWTDGEIENGTAAEGSQKETE
jgi:hypothetical protein